MYCEGGQGLGTVSTEVLRKKSVLLKKPNNPVTVRFLGKFRPVVHCFLSESKAVFRLNKIESLTTVESQNSKAKENQ